MNEDRTRVTAVARKEPDIGLYVLALIALARQLQEQDESKNAAESAHHIGVSAKPAAASEGGA